MKRHTTVLYGLALSLLTVLSHNLYGQTQDFFIQHIQNDVDNSGDTTNNFIEVSSLNSAFVLLNNNRRSSAGDEGNGSNLNGDDLSGANVLTAVNTISYYRESNSMNSDTRFSSSIWEYKGEQGGPNEMIVRERFQVSLNGSNNSTTKSLSGIVNANKCIPFITGILNDDSSQGADSGTALAYLEDASTLRIQKGSNGNNVTVFITVVEFTGSNWTVLHGDSGNVSSSTGNITLKDGSDGTGTTTSVSQWSNAIIFGHHRGDNTSSGANQAIADNWPIFEPNGSTDKVDWVFHSNHGSNGTNRHFVHVLSNPNLNVSRFQSSENASNESTIDITSANISNTNQAIIVGSSISSGGGTAYGRGWRNYYFNSNTEAAHWSHRSGNSMSHEIQIIDFSGVNSEGYCTSWGHTTWNTGITNVKFNTIDHSDGSPKDSGYEDFTSTQSTTVYRNTIRSLNVNVDTDGDYSAHVFAWIDWNQDLDFNDDGESYDLGSADDVSDGSTDLSPFAITIPSDATLGATRMRIAVNFEADPTLCATNFDGEVEDYEIIVSDGVSNSEINITGNGFNILNQDNSPILLDFTDFGNVSVESTLSRSFVIENLGINNNLSLTGSSPYISLSGANSGEFSVTTTPSNSINPNSNTNFTIAFNPTSDGLKTATVTIANDDNDESSYSFSIQGNAVLGEFCESYGNLDYQTSITNVTFNTLDHSDDGEKNVGYEDFTNSQSTTVEAGSSYDLSVSVDTDGNYIVYTNVWIDWNGDYDFEDDGETYDLGYAVNVEDGITDLSPLTVLVPEDAAIGSTRMRVSAKYWDYPDDCEIDFDGEVEDYTIVVSAAPAPEIVVIGNDNEISYGDSTPSPTDHTDLGSANTNQTISRVFTINNSGSLDLEISDISLSNTTDFSFIGDAYDNTVEANGSTTFEIAFNSSTLGEKTSDVTITNNATSGSSYQFTIKATAVASFFDSDGDGVLDNIDIDDDNDGIRDSEEELDCDNTNIALKVNYKFLNETFGTGERTTINTTYDAVTTYCYEDGTSSCSSGGIDLNDGEYTVYYRAADGDGVNDTPNEEVGSWADTYWYLGEDHTPDDTNGRMAMFNASYDPGIFYTANITGALPGIPITYSFWVLNLDRSDAPNIGSRLRPDILVEFRDVDDNVLASITTGEIAPTAAGNLQGDWYNFSADLTFNVSEFNVYFYNNETGGLGNDLAIDDIQITQTLCDTDGDNVANVFDLDSDNDGIPDAVEAGYTATTNGKGIIDNWSDNNGNGMHDAYEGLTPLDSDNEGVPNYIDLDSDNDAIFDVDESGAGNSINTSFQNGDGDIDGDGVGDGEDSDAVREKDVDSDGSVEYFADGILDIYDYLDGSTFETAYGNQNQGVSHTNYVADSDDDGTPDYIDVYNNSNDTYDISNTLYYYYDENNDGIIDDTVDTDGDGILDLFDTNDNSFGSPRDINVNLQVHFDGRNDYIQDESVIDNWGEITLMGWIKIDNDGSGDRFLFGQDNFSLKLLSNGNLQANISGTIVNYNTAIPTNHWTHVAIGYSATEEVYKLYINGEVVESGSRTGLLDTDSSPFTMAKDPSSNNDYFKGTLDEIRLFNKSLSSDEVSKMVYQKIEDNGYVRGSEIPLDIETLQWSNLIKYYKLDIYKGNITDDYTTPSIDEGSGATLYNIKNITEETAPIPFVSYYGNSDLESALSKPEDGVYGIDAIFYEWSIVKINHDDITFDGDQKHLGLIVEENDPSLNHIEFHVTNDSELNVSWYLKLDGFIDLEGESQLVQGENSILDVSSKGRIERDQQGTSDTFTYNYWSSPVGTINSTTNNNDYTISSILRDGSDPNNPQAINWITSGYNGTDTSPIGIAHYWIWKYANNPANDYSSWQHAKSNGNMSAGEGYTMKGPGTGAIDDDQNYVYVGKPNNGTITLPLSADNNYLIGNPYASAIDANEFINDNPNLTGTIALWEHWGGGSHNLQEYRGGYARYNLAGGVPASAPHPDVAQVGVGTKTPGRYIPVGQGFFVKGESSGTITFENDQRIFKKEGSSSVFFRGPSEIVDDEDVDDRMKFRFRFTGSNALQLQRQLLLTIDENTTAGVDWAYDAPLNEGQTDDMFWLINSEKFAIQANNNADINTVYPLGIKASTDGIIKIEIEALENVPDTVNIYLHDIYNASYHDLRVSDFETTITIGEHLDKYEITFDNASETLSMDDLDIDEMRIYYASHRNKIVVLNPDMIELEQLNLYNINGQSVYENARLWTESYNEFDTPSLSTGVYIIELKTQRGVVSKKIVIK